MDEAGNFGRRGPARGGSGEMVLKLAQRRMEPVADLGLEQATEALDRVEFRRVGRQRQKAQIGRDAGVALRQVKAGLVLDHDVQGERIGISDLLEKKGVDIPVDGGGE